MIQLGLIFSLLLAPTLLSSSIETMTETPFAPFTGKITRPKVRIRTQASLDGAIVKELQKGEYVLVTGLTDEYYIIKPPEGIKAYIFRTFVLDNIVEGKNVNVRLNPDTNAPIIAHLNQGDTVDGTVSTSNPKWLEITPPATTKLYISRDFVENVGNSELLTKLQSRLKTVTDLFNQALTTSQIELQKAFEKMNIEEAKGKLNNIIQNYVDFPEYTAKAKELLNSIQDKVLQKKLTYLEAKVHDWASAENALFETWASDREEATLEDFYESQKKSALVLTGIMEPYVRQSSRKAGDFVLLSKKNRQPLAYLYSTRVDLAAKNGKEVNLLVVQRHAANQPYPVYFVLSIE